MSAPVPPIVFRWTPTRADVEDAMVVYRRALGVRALVLTYLPVLALLLFALSFALLGGGVWQVGPFVAAAALFAGFAVRINDRAVWRSPLARQPVEAVASPYGLRVTGPYATTEWQWRSFDRAVETRRSFVLLGGAADGQRAQLFCYLPKGALPHPAEVDRLRALLGTMLPGGVRPR